MDEAAVADGLERLVRGNLSSDVPGLESEDPAES